MSNAVKTRLRLGKIDYINALPFYHGLDLGGNIEVDSHEAYPSRINLAMRKGKIDIALISSLEYLNHQDKYAILPNLCVGARDFSGSVILFSKDKIEGVNGKTIALSKHSLSSSILLRILLKFKYKFNNDFKVCDSNPKEMLEKFPATLVIGDDALMYEPTDFVYKYDLSELWWSWAEKPFCFALWAVRKDYAKENPEVVKACYEKLRANLDRNLGDLETLIKESLELSFLDTGFSKIFAYLFNLHYGLDGPTLEGLELFYRLSNRLKFSPRLKSLDFISVE